MSTSSESKAAFATPVETQNDQGAWRNDAFIPPNDYLPPPYLSDCPPYAPYYVRPPAPMVIVHQPVPVKQSYASHVFLACCVFWLCGTVFGLVALILAMFASMRASKLDHDGAARLASASYAISLCGLAVGILIWGLVIWQIMYAIDDSNKNSCGYLWSCQDSCWRHRSAVSFSTCTKLYPISCYKEGYCYYE